MYFLEEKRGLIWRTSPACDKSGWDEMGLQLRWDTLLKRAQILSEPEPNWFGKIYTPRSERAIQTNWNLIAELMLLGVMEKGYLAFISPSNQNGFKLELIGFMDTLKILVLDNGGIVWDLYREKGVPLDSEDYTADTGFMGEEFLVGGHFGSDGEELGGDGMLSISSSSQLCHTGHYFPEEDNQQIHTQGRHFRKILASVLQGYTGGFD